MPCVKDVLTALLSWAPTAVAWERDNIGLLVGRADAAVSRALVCLDVTPGVVEEAVREGAELIIAHHPVIFHPLKSLRTDTTQGAMLAELLRKNISVIALHTNADAALGGLNHALAARLELTDVTVLDAARGQLRATTLRLPVDPLLIDEAIARLRDIDDVDAQRRTTDNEQAAIEIIAPSWRNAEIRGMIARLLGDLTHSVTEIRLEDAVAGYGIGAVGHLAQPLSAAHFLGKVKSALDCEMLRVSPCEDDRMIRRVAVCSGAGSSYIHAAIAAGADALVTGDLTHHYFLDHQTEILLVDAGHYHTERIFIDLCAGVLSNLVFENSKKIDILRGRTNTNPIRFV
jgi:dinuclear metal center YbgI/SA1388 family protein